MANTTSFTKQFRIINNIRLEMQVRSPSACSLGHHFETHTR